jgi:DNA-binding transcriptional regulator YdaS (Cro superfamily)
VYDAKKGVTMKLKDYIEKNGVKKIDFAAKIGASPSALTCWMNGSRTPRPEFMRAIWCETKGKVTPNDFL